MWEFHWKRLTTILILLPLVLISVIACKFSFSSPLTSKNKSSVSSFFGSGKYQSDQPLNLLQGVDDFSSSLNSTYISPAPEPASDIYWDDQNDKDENLQANSTLPVDGSTDSDAETKIIRIYSKLEKIEARLVKVRQAIKEAVRYRNLTSIHEDPDYVPYGPVYRNANAFHRSYLEMEKLFKIYVYNEGDRPIFHNGLCKSIYSTEGRLIHEIEKGTLYKTEDPEEALVYLLPFSVVMMVQYLYVPGAREIHAIENTVTDYINVISQNHRYWNRSQGADHFMVSCHDWGPRTTFHVPNLFNNSIRVLCNANTSEGFNPAKDVSLPEINLLTGEITGLVGGPSPSKRPILAFFAGRLHGHIRYLLLEQWKEKDSDVQVYDSLPKGVSYQTMLRRSRFCLCPSGFEVASPRVVEAIYSECIPVLISDGYIPPLSDVLDWKTFSVQVDVKDIANIKTILMSIPQRQYLRMHRRVKQVQRHFVMNPSPKRFDFFHMMIHSIWLRRLNVQIED